VYFTPLFPEELKGSLEHDRYTPHLPRDFVSSTGLNRSEIWGSTNRAEYEFLGSGILWCGVVVVDSMGIYIV
jgi:hypothetical protein